MHGIIMLCKNKPLFNANMKINYKKQISWNLRHLKHPSRYMVYLR